MSLSAKPTPLKVFISSTYSDNKLLRERLASSLVSEGYAAVIAEHTSSAKGFITKDNSFQPDVIEVSDTCLLEVSSSDIIIAIITGRLGSSIRFNDEIFRARHFELEIFSALMQGKPVFVCTYSDFKPDPATDAFIKCVMEDKPVHPMRDENDLITSVIKYCDDVREKETTKKILDNSLSLTQNLSILRAYYRSLRSHQMFLPFLGAQLTEAAVPNLEYAQEALDDMEKQDDLHLKFSRLWIALRELLPSLPQRNKDQRMVTLWDKLLVGWAYSSSWYGLHAHLYLGAVAAATNLWNLRSIRSNHDDDGGMPVWIIASANYSLIQRIPVAPIRYLAFLSLLRFLDKRMNLSSKYGDNLLIRGSINLRLLMVPASVVDFRKAVKFFEDSGSASEIVGDAKTHLAVPLAILGKRREARMLMDEGISYMRGRADPGNLLRALRKAIRIEKLPFGDRERAAEFHKEANLIKANSKGYLDQARHFSSRE